MNPILPAILAVVFFQICFAQIHQSAFPTSYSAKQHISLSSSFTDGSNYNSYDFAGNPLGKLEKDSNIIELNAGYRLYNSSANGPQDSSGKYNGFVLPVISLHPSSNFLMSLNYSLNSIKTDSNSLPVHQFGIMMISQTNKKFFQGGFAAQGFIGKEKPVVGDNTRSLIGLEDVGVCIGSQMGPLVNLGVYAHAAFLLDTLLNSNENVLLQERYASVKLPQIDVTGDINIPNIKDKASLYFTFAKEDFVCTEKSDNNSLVNTFHATTGNNGTENQWDADPIQNDSIAFGLQNMTSFNLNDSVWLIPSIALGYMQNNFVRMKPGNNNQPFSYNGMRSGYDWKTGSLRFGIGSSVDFFSMTDVWLEYSFSTLKLTLGDKYPDSLKDSNSKNLNRFGIGSKLNFARIPALNISKSTDLAFTIGYLFEQRNKLLSTYRGDAFSYVQPIAVNTQLNRYTPWIQFSETTTSSGIQTGLHTSFKDDTFITDLYFIYASESISGDNKRDGHEIEAGLDLILNVKRHNK
jgi:hypothetical protein